MFWLTGNYLFNTFIELKHTFPNCYDKGTVFCAAELPDDGRRYHCDVSYRSGQPLYHRRQRSHWRGRQLNIIRVRHCYFFTIDIRHPVTIIIDFCIYMIPHILFICLQLHTSVSISLYLQSPVSMYNFRISTCVCTTLYLARPQLHHTLWGVRRWMKWKCI